MKNAHQLLKTCVSLAVVACGIILLIGCGGGGSGSSSGSVSGLILTGQGQVLDGDTKDPNNQPLSNDTLSNPQPLLIPSTVGGNADEITDPDDIYRIELDGPVTIVLAIADPDAGDLDLYLTQTDGTIVERSDGFGALESIQPPAGLNGRYLVIVNAFDGSSNYVLSIGVSATSAVLSSLPDAGDAFVANAEFVPDEIIVKMRTEPADGRHRSSMSDVAAFYGMTKVAASPSGTSLMRMSRIENSPFLLERKSRKKRGTFLKHESEDKRRRARTMATIKALRQHPAVEYAEPNYISRINREPDDKFYEFQWHYPAINLPLAWDVTTGDDGVVVGVIDTGVLVKHPDLSSRILRDSGKVVGYDFISDPARANDGDGIDPDPNDSGDNALGSRSSFHGTHVAGTVAAATDNLTGVAGVTWQGRIMPLRALGIGGGTDFDIAQAILYAARQPNASNTLPFKKADILNLSLGPNNRFCQPLPLSNTLREAVDKAQAAGVIVVVAAGNDNCDVPTPLATIEGVINVSATDIFRQKAPYSNFGSSIDVAAPGGNTGVDGDGDGIVDGVISTLADDSGSSVVFQYGIYQGTSMAAPHVAGVFALMRAVNDQLTPADINQLLRGASTDPDAGPITIDIGSSNLFGYGLIDAFQAVTVANRIDGGANLPQPENPVLAVFPERLNFSFTASILQIAVSNPGLKDLEITAISASKPWLSVTAPATPFTIPAGSQTATVLTVEVDRSGLADGTYIAKIDISSNAGNKSIPVSMQIQDNVGGDVGVVYVLVVDPDSLETIAQDQTRALDGYVYRTPQVVPGRYLIAAGTDKDNDGAVCDPGEACGIFPLADNPDEIDIDGDVAGIDFAVTYELFASGSALASFGTAQQPFAGFHRMDVKGLNR